MRHAIPFVLVLVLAHVAVAVAAPADPPRPPFEQLVTQLDDVLADTARGAAAGELAPRVQALRPLAQAALTGDPTTRELTKQLLALHLRPAAFEVSRGSRMDRARVVRELTAARDVARLALAPPPLDGRLSITMGDRTYDVDFKQLYAVSRAEALRHAGSAGGPHQATVAEVDALIAGYSSGAATWVPALRRWFHFQAPTPTAEEVSARVSALMEHYLARPENLVELGPRVGLTVSRKVRLAAFVLRTLRRFGVDVRLPGGSDAALAATRDEVAGMLTDLAEVFPIFWGQLRTGINMSAASGGPDGGQLVRDAFRSFANPAGVAARAGLLLSPTQEARLKAALVNQADTLAADLDAFYAYRTAHGATESLPAFVAALMDDLTVPR